MEENTIHRKPLTDDELARLLDCTDVAPEIRPVIVTAICTGMRRADCCLLKWADVDRDEGMIRLPSKKTGEPLRIPILPLLAREIEAQSKTGEYVFPVVAEMYLANAQGITSRAKKVFAAAFGQESRFGGKLQADREQGHRRASVRDLHALRVTWVTNQLNAGTPIELVTAVTGLPKSPPVSKLMSQQAFRDLLWTGSILCYVNQD